MSNMITRLLTGFLGNSSSRNGPEPVTQPYRPDPEPKPVINQVQVIPTRILELFAAHKIDMLTASEILGVPFSAMVPRRLARHIDNPMIDRLVKLFSVNRDWLLGQSNLRGAYRLTWYKTFGAAGRHLLDRANEPDVTKIRVLFLSPESWDLKAIMTKDKGRYEFVVVVELTRQTASGHQFQTFDRFQDMLWNDEVTRAYVLALGIFCDLTASSTASNLFPYEKRPTCDGLAIPDRVFNRFRQNGDMFPAEVLETRAGYGAATKLYNFLLGPDAEDGVSAKEFSEAKAKAEAMIASLVAEKKRKRDLDAKIARIDGKPDLNTGLDDDDFDDEFRQADDN